jgi:hypothetical protein
MRPRQERDPQNPSSLVPILTTAEILSDDTILELVRVHEQSMLHVWRNGKARLATQYEIAGTIYEPLPLDASLLAAIRFPSGSASYGSIGQLFESIVSALARFSGLPSQDLTAAAYWVLASWFTECLPMSPTLLVSGPSPAGVCKFLRLLSCLCRRGIVLTEVSAGGFLSLPIYLRPTLLLQQPRVDRRTRGLLRAAGGSNYVPSRGKLLDLGCARAISSEQDDLDADLREGCVTVSLFPSAAELPVFDKSEEDKLAAELQPRLLRFRCKNFRKVAASRFDMPEFTTGMRELARSLGAPVLGDPNLEAGIIALLSAQDADFRATLATRPEVAVIISLLALIHERKDARISVTSLTSFANAALRASGEIREYSPLEIGRLLSRLSIPRMRIASGMVIDFTRDVSRRVHQLKRRFGVVTTPASFPSCSDCEPSETAADRQLV